MANPMKYIIDLDAAGFERGQAEAQVQMVLDAVEGDLATKADFAVFRAQTDLRFLQFENRMDQFGAKIENRFNQFEEKMDRRFIESEFRTLSRMGIMMASMILIAVAVLTWLIKM